MVLICLMRFVILSCPLVLLCVEQLRESELEQYDQTVEILIRGQGNNVLLLHKRNGMVS